MAEDRGRVHRGTSEFRLKQIELTIPTRPRAHLEAIRPTRMRVESLPKLCQIVICLAHEAILRARLPLTCPAVSTQPLSRATGLQFECQRIGSRKNRCSRLSADRIAVLSAGAKRGSTAPASAQRFEPGYGPRFRARPLRQRPAAQAPDSDR